jgi:phage terminase small subunit
VSEPKPLTPKQERFCEEYLVDFNASAAARRAGYSEHTAGKIGLENLQKPAISERISTIRKERSEVVQVDAIKVLTELCKLGFSNMADFVRSQPDGSIVTDFSQLTRDQAAAITEVVVEEYMDGRGDDARPVKRTKFKLADKRGALELIARHLGMFDDKLRLMNADGGPLHPVFVMQMTKVETGGGS